MRNFILGFLAASLLFGGYLIFESRSRARIDPMALPETDGGAELAQGRGKSRRRGGHRGRRRASREQPGGNEAAEATEPAADEPPAGRTVSPAELKPVTQGDGLQGTDVLNMDEKDSGRDVPQEELDATFAKRRSAILECIDKSRGDAAAHPGRVVVGVRIVRGGQIAKLRVTGPAYMMKSGLHGCVRRATAGLRFPSPSSSVVASFPFELR